MRATKSNTWLTKVKWLLWELQPTLDKLLRVSKIWFILSWKMSALNAPFLNCHFDNQAAAKISILLIFALTRKPDPWYRQERASSLRQEEEGPAAERRHRRPPRNWRWRYYNPYLEGSLGGTVVECLLSQPRTRVRFPAKDFSSENSLSAPFPFRQLSLSKLGFSRSYFSSITGEANFVYSLLTFLVAFCQSLKLRFRSSYRRLTSHFHRRLIHAPAFTQFQLVLSFRYVFIET